MPFPPPRKTIVGVGSRERAPMKAVTTHTSMVPNKTVVGSTAQAPRKDVVGNLSAPRPKTLVGNLSAPPPKITSSNLGTGGNKPLPMAAANRGPINAANPRTTMGPLGSNNGNLGRSVSSTPPPAQGPTNPTLNWAQPWNVTDIEDGGMGPTAKRMGVARRPNRTPRRASQFFGE